MALKGRNLLSSLFASSRSSLTCTYKCGNACFGECENKSNNPYFADQFSRRTALRVGSLSVVTVGGGAAPPSSRGGTGARSGVVLPRLGRMMRRLDLRAGTPAPAGRGPD